MFQPNSKLPFYITNNTYENDSPENDQHCKCTLRYNLALEVLEYINLDLHFQK